MRFCAAIGMALMAAAQAQPAFEVASVKQDPYKAQGSIGAVFVRGDTLTAEHVPLNGLVPLAYNLRPSSFPADPRGPRWVRSTPPDCSPSHRKPGDSPPSMEVFCQMFQGRLGGPRSTQSSPCSEGDAGLQSSPRQGCSQKTRLQAQRAQNSLRWRLPRNNSSA